MHAVRHARGQPVQQGARAGAGDAGGLAVGLRELVPHAAQVEQVRRGLRHQPDERARLGGVHLVRVAAVDVDTAPLTRARALQRPQQRRLARAVAAHERGDLPVAQREVDVPHGDDVVVAHLDATGGQRHLAVARRGPGRAERSALPARRARGPRDGGRRARTAAAAPSRRGDPARRRAGRRPCWSNISAGNPSCTVPSPGRWMTRSAYCTTRSSRCSASTTVTPRSCTRRVTAASTSSAAVGSSADVGSSSTSTRGCAVSTAPIATRCCWPPDSSCRPAGAQVGEAEQVEGLLDPLAHDVRRHGQLLHAVGELLLDGVGDEARDRVLPDDPHDVGELARRVRRGVASVDDDPAGQRAAGEVRDQAVDRPEQRRLAGAGAPDDEAELALLDVQRDVAEHRRRRVGVGDGHVLEVDHADTRSRSVRGRRWHGARAGGSARRRTGGGAANAAAPASRIARAGTSGSGG